MKSETISVKPGNETIKTIFDRRAVRQYRPQMIDDDLLEQILNAGRMAPSAMNGQPWKFYVVTHRDTIDAFSKEITKVIPKLLVKMALKHPMKAIKTLLHSSHDQVTAEDDHIFHGAPVVIFITSPKDNEWGGLETGMCAQNMMLAARSLGLDSCPVGLAKYIDQTSLYQQLEASESEKVQLAIVFGYGAESPSMQPRARHTTIFIDRMECC
ncbi:nitroreductase family protein [Mucilaginibacter sp. 14171R-50]|uniref:nitroreductase family protein n=1 Tax=Mucilaginibacter sp. 14171R-50 TaxID=2703789 RepID=UPI00138D5A71|nr:nitroreductase family protein [Mucilaginibacter sp. 14171R-50]QHS55329.1 nitroreductase family protein [Mucilaginibacter sp. 14171R-50]